jgi:hypothetical protein
MTSKIELYDWRSVERIVGLTHRLGCAYTRLEVRAEDPAAAPRTRYKAEIDFIGSPEALGRLSAQITRLLNDEREMAR